MTSAEDLNKGVSWGTCVELKNMRSLLLLTTLLCLFAALAETQHNANRVKLCGRSFLRAVVYTCGGSRWRRVTADQESLQSSE